MKKQYWKLTTTSLLVALFAGLAPVACGGDDPAGDGDGNGDGDMGGGNGDGDNGDGDNGDGDNGDGDNGDGDNGDGDSPSTASIDDLIGAICEWEFGCCSDGELTYRLGPAGSSVEDCVEYFTFQLHESNVTNNPFPGGTAAGLLGTLAFTVDLSRVSENGENIAACIEQYKDQSCPSKGVAATFCEGSTFPGDSACELGNLFDPALKIGDRCTLALAEGSLNDVECPSGSTCLAAGDVDNPEDFPTCVQRSKDGQPCTADDDCDYNFYCDSSGDCAEKGDAGDDCTFNDADEPKPDDEDASCKPGLRCDPVDNKCVENCALDYPCVVNAECPEDHVCAPVNVGDDADTWKACQPIGSSASDRCDEDADCVNSLYCDGSVCVADFKLAGADSCVRDAQCEAGSFCDTAATGPDGLARVATNKCTAYYQPSTACFPGGGEAGTPSFVYSSGCNPKGAPLCLKNATLGEWQCATALRKAGDECSTQIAGANECKPGLSCEVTEVGKETCTAGGEAGDDCDDDKSTDDDLSCGAGFTCKDAECVAQVNPGQDCEDADAAGTADPTMCKNSSCVENWDENGVDFICTDAPIPASNGGDDLTCGG